jgi:hypothetical protein
MVLTLSSFAVSLRAVCNCSPTACCVYLHRLLESCSCQVLRFCHGHTHIKPTVPINRRDKCHSHIQSICTACPRRCDIIQTVICTGCTARTALARRPIAASRLTPKHTCYCSVVTAYCTVTDDMHDDSQPPHCHTGGCAISEYSCSEALPQYVHSHVYFLECCCFTRLLGASLSGTHNPARPPASAAPPRRLVLL